MSTSTANTLATVSLPQSASEPQKNCTPPDDLQLATTDDNSLEVVLSPHCMSKCKPAAVSSQEVQSTLLTSPCPTIATHQTPKPASALSNAVQHQQPQTETLPPAVSLPCPTAWVCPVVYQHPNVPLFTEGSSCPPNSSQSEIANSEMGVPGQADSYTLPSYTITTEYPTTNGYSNNRAYFSTGPCSETSILPSMQTYAATEAYPVTCCLPSSGYSTVALAYSLPVFSQAAVNSQTTLNYQNPEGIVGSGNQIHSSTLYCNHVCPGSLGRIPDYRGRIENALSICSSQPSHSNTEVIPITSDYPENRSYSESLVRQPCEFPAGSYNTVPVIPALCYPTASTFPVMTECHTSPSVEDYTQSSVCQSTSTNQQAFNNHQPLINRSVMTFNSVNQRPCANHQSPSHRILHHQRHSTPVRHTNQHCLGIQRVMDQERSPDNNCTSTNYRTAINICPSSNQRPTQRPGTSQQTFYRSPPIHPPPLQTPMTYPPAPAYQSNLPINPVPTNQAGIHLRAITPYGATYQPVASSTCHTSPRHQPAFAYQTGDESVTTNEPASTFLPLVVRQDANPHQQSDTVYPNDGACQSEAPCLPEQVNQTAVTYETPGTYPDALQQPPAYQTSLCTPAPNYSQSDVYQPASMYQHQAHMFQTPPFQQESANPIYQVVPPHQASPMGHPHGIPNEVCRAGQPLNWQCIPYPQVSYVPAIQTAYNQNSNETVPAGEAASLRHEATEQQSSYVHQPIMGYCTNSACLESGSCHDTFGEAQRSLTEVSDQQTGSYLGNARDCSITIGTPENCVSQTTCDQQFTGNPRAMQMCKIRPDYPVISSLPLRPYSTTAENMESASMTSGQPAVYFTSVNLENNEETTTGQPIPPSRLHWINPSIPAPTQMYEFVDEEAYGNGEGNSRRTNIQETTSANNPNNLVCCNCNPHIQTQAYNVSDENCQVYPQVPEQPRGSGDMQCNSLPRRNLIMGADGCVYQGSPVFLRDEQPHGPRTRGELGDGDCDKIQCCDRTQLQVQEEHYAPSKCMVRTDNRYSVYHTDGNCYDCENVNTPRQYCHVCNRCYSNSGRSYINGFAQPLQPGGHWVMREPSNDISSNLSQLSLNDPAQIAS